MRRDVEGGEEAALGELLDGFEDRGGVLLVLRHVRLVGQRALVLRRVQLDPALAAVGVRVQVRLVARLDRVDVLDPDAVHGGLRPGDGLAEVLGRHRDLHHVLGRREVAREAPVRGPDRRVSDVLVVVLLRYGEGGRFLPREVFPVVRRSAAEADDGVPACPGRYGLDEILREYVGLAVVGLGVPRERRLLEREAAKAGVNVRRSALGRVFGDLDGEGRGLVGKYRCGSNSRDGQK